MEEKAIQSNACSENQATTSADVDSLHAQLLAQGAFENTLPVVDAATQGFLPTASALENHDALQRALDSGNRKVVVKIPGEYRIQETVFLDDNTVLEFAPNTVLKKNGHYAHVLANRGAFEYRQNKNIILRGLNLSLKDSEAAISEMDTNAPGMRGQVAFYNIQNIQIFDFNSSDNNNGRQYTLQIAGFDGFLLDGFVIRGEKDGVHLNAGTNFVIRNGTLRTADDGIALNAGDWPVTCTPIIGSITNGLVENVIDEPGGACNFARVITGVWGDWHPGMILHRGDMFNYQGKTYTVALPLDGKTVRSETPPTHSHGVWKSPEGIPFLYLQEASTTHADIRNVTFRNIQLHAQRSFGCWWELLNYSRLIHPDIPTENYPMIDIALDNVTIDSGTPLVLAAACGHFKMRKVKSTGRLVSAWTSTYLGKYYPVKLDVSLEECIFVKENQADYDFVFEDVPDGQSEATLTLMNCAFEHEPRIANTMKLKVTKES